MALLKDSLREIFNFRINKNMYYLIVSVNTDED